jgi:hypothetical protein
MSFSNIAPNEKNREEEEQQQQTTTTDGRRVSFPWPDLLPRPVATTIRFQIGRRS